MADRCSKKKRFFENCLGIHQDMKSLSLHLRQQPLSITKYLIERMKTSSALAKQFTPSQDEENIYPEEQDDPTGDNIYTPVKGIIHRYPDRALLVPHLTCAAYCRFCFRREKLGRADGTLTLEELKNAISYIKTSDSIWEVILSGGDPLMLELKKLEFLLLTLVDIPHLGVIRLHTRLPVSDPSRVSGEMIAVLTSVESKCLNAGDKTLYMILHCNHIDELSPETTAACHAITQSGVPMLAQTVLLRGINDTPLALEALFRALVQRRIKPYYLHHCDLARGTGHFRTTLAEGQELMRILQGRLSGLCLPNYVLDIPGGYGKVPVGPHYLHGDLEIATEVEDCTGRRHQYPPRLCKDN